MSVGGADIRCDISAHTPDTRAAPKQAARFSTFNSNPGLSGLRCEVTGIESIIDRVVNGVPRDDGVVDIQIIMVASY